MLQARILKSRERHKGREENSLATRSKLAAGEPGFKLVSVRLGGEGLHKTLPVVFSCKLAEFFEKFSELEQRW